MTNLPNSQRPGQPQTVGFFVVPEPWSTRLCETCGYLAANFSDLRRHIDRHVRKAQA